ncbi:MAG: (d)CMP kinase [Desulfobacteraceae bacterium]|nr:(d)CMP kinase [Desulfobacteraceae bacterium]MCF8095736.1 (d)CMP kinase [Desulfobacteraceae bacterium]
MNKQLIVIDGPAGAGKTTVSKALAQRLQYRYIDTGALYRGVAWEILEKGVDPEDEESLAGVLTGLDLRFARTNQGMRLYSSGTDITEYIRTPQITMLASAASAKPMVRHALMDLQREMGKQKAAVFEGRDMGTVVFPDADVKFFLTADLKVRAKRRFAELKKTSPQSLEKVEEQMRQRDTNDSSRSAAPLKPADDAIMVDSTDKSVDKVVEEMLENIRASAG